MKTKVLVAVLSMSCMMAMLAGLSIAQNQTGSGNSNSGQSGNANRGSGATAARQGSNSADAKFAMTAAQDSMTEVELGRLAVQKGMSDAVKQFGQRMIDDHTNANQQLMQAAQASGITLPTTLDAKHAAMVQKFQRLSGAEFDRQYAKQMVQDHRKAVSLFQQEASRGTNAGIKAFASQTLPVLQEHLSMAQALSGGTGRAGGNMNSGSSNMNGGGGNMNSGNMNSGNGNMGGGSMNGNSNTGSGGGNSNRGGNRNTNSGGGNSNNSNRR
jgi:predicted outer membrane protein